MSTIAAGTTSGTALVSTGDTTGALVLQTNGSTTAVTIATNQVVTLAQPLPVGSGGTGATSLSGLTVGTATTATNLAGGSNGTIPYQSAAGTTQMLAVGSAGQVLQTNGAGAPSWVTVASGLSAATQAQMEAASSNTVAATPFNTQFHPGVAKVWFKVGSLFNSGVIMASYNVTSVVDGTGALTVTIGTDFSTDNYAVVATPEYSQPNPSADKLTVGVQRGTMAAGSFQLLCVNYTNTLFDPDYYLCAAFGDQ